MSLTWMPTAGSNTFRQLKNVNEQNEQHPAVTFFHKPLILAEFIPLFDEFPQKE